GGGAGGVIAGCELEHAVIEAVEARQRDELELVAHGGELALEARDGGVVEMGAPVERRRAVVGQELAGELAMDRGRECTRFIEIGARGLPPQQIGVTGARESALDAMREAGVRPEAIQALS